MMSVLMSPFSFYFLAFYMGFLLMISMVSTFIEVWVIMECAMFILMGVFLSMSNMKYSSIFLYYITQCVASILLAVMWVNCQYLLIMVVFSLKLGMYPFCSWFLKFVMDMGLFPLFMVSIAQKIPPFLLMSFVLPNMSVFVVWVFLLMTVLYSSSVMVYSYELLSIVLLSSISNNAWLMMGLLSSYKLVVLYLMVYGISLLYLLSWMGLTTPMDSKRGDKSGDKLALWGISLSGIPPFPLFFMKLMVIFSLVEGGYSPLLLSGALFMFIPVMMGQIMYFSKAKTYVSYSKVHLYL